MNARIAILITAGVLLVGPPAWSTEHEAAMGEPAAT